MHCGSLGKGNYTLQGRIDPVQTVPLGQEWVCLAVFPEIKRKQKQLFLFFPCVGIWRLDSGIMPSETTLDQSYDPSSLSGCAMFVWTARSECQTATFYLSTVLEEVFLGESVN